MTQQVVRSSFAGFDVRVETQPAARSSFGEFGVELFGAGGLCRGKASVVASN